MPIAQQIEVWTRCAVCDPVFLKYMLKLCLTLKLPPVYFCPYSEDLLLFSTLFVIPFPSSVFLELIDYLTEPYLNRCKKLMNACWNVCVNPSKMIFKLWRYASKYCYSHLVQQVPWKSLDLCQENEISYERLFCPQRKTTGLYMRTKLRIYITTLTLKKFNRVTRYITNVSILPIFGFGSVRSFNLSLAIVYL